MVIVVELDGVDLVTMGLNGGADVVTGSVDGGMFTSSSLESGRLKLT